MNIENGNKGTKNDCLTKSTSTQINHTRRRGCGHGSKSVDYACTKRSRYCRRYHGGEPRARIAPNTDTFKDRLTYLTLVNLSPYRSLKVLQLANLLRPKSARNAVSVCLQWGEEICNDVSYVSNSRGVAILSISMFMTKFKKPIWTFFLSYGHM